MVHLTETCDEDRPRLVVHADTTAGDVHEAGGPTPSSVPLTSGGSRPPSTWSTRPTSAPVSWWRWRTATGSGSSGRLGGTSSWQVRAEGGYTADRFDLDWHREVATCPEGKESADVADLHSIGTAGEYVVAVRPGGPSESTVPRVRRERQCHARQAGADWRPATSAASRPPPHPQRNARRGWVPRRTPCQTGKTARWPSTEVDTVAAQTPSAGRPSSTRRSGDGTGRGARTRTRRTDETMTRWGARCASHHPPLQRGGHGQPDEPPVEPRRPPPRAARGCDLPFPPAPLRSVTRWQRARRVAESPRRVQWGRFQPFVRYGPESNPHNRHYEGTPKKR